ncbi:hypothetical protein [Enterococcus sp. DIV1314a]|uniref:helix-turn-helix domain-containing protein n=1 Tax=Enterococcus sp. DIV1314a TaxID=2774660 RepID=UPI003F287DC3
MIGIKIKKIRVSKNISPINVYSGIMSRSNYWKLEEGLISPSFETVIQLLQRINLDVEEFLMLLQHDTLLFYNQTKDQRNFFFKKKDAEGLLNLAQQLQQQYKQTKALQLRHLALTCNLYHSRLTEKPPNPQIMTELKQYLFGCNDWSLYELRLFNSIFFIFDYETSKVLLKRALKTIQHNQQRIDEKISFLVNFLSLAVQNNDLKQIKIIDETLQNDVELPHKSTYNRILLAWAKQIIQAYMTRNRQYIHKAFEIIAIFDTLDMDGPYNMYNAWTNDYQSFIFGSD